MGCFTDSLVVVLFNVSKVVRVKAISVNLDVDIFDNTELEKKMHGYLI